MDPTLDCEIHSWGRTDPDSTVLRQQLLSPYLFLISCQGLCIGSLISAMVGINKLQNPENASNSFSRHVRKFTSEKRLCDSGEEREECNRDSK
jgi:hypothetical protein